MNSTHSTHSVAHALPKCSDNLQTAYSDASATTPAQQYVYTDQPTGGPQPAPQPSLWANIPEELRQLRQWCVAGADKRPLTANCVPASVKNPSTWGDFDPICKAAQDKGLHIGFMLHVDDPYACIDLDVKDSTAPQVLKEHQDVISTFDSYTEHSRSGKGFHVWIKASIGEGKRRDGVEFYSQERFIICTGDVYLDRKVQDRQKAAEQLCEKLRTRTADIYPLPDQPQQLSDEEVLAKARAAANGAKFSAHYDGTPGDISPDNSVADMALVQMIAFHTPNNDQLKRLFMASVRGRRDKLKKHPTYLDITVRSVRTNQAINAREIDVGQKIAETLLAKFDQKLKQQVKCSKFKIYSAAEILARPPVRWRVQGVIPQEGIGSIYGQPGSGKSFLAIDLLAAVANGHWWFGLKTKAAPVVYIALEGRGGISQRLRAYAAKKGQPDIAFMDMPFDIREAEQREYLVLAIKESGLEGGIVCIDTLAASAPGMDENGSADMGLVISGMLEVQQKLGGCVLFVHHAGKNGDRGMRGHSSLHGAVDFSLEVTTDESKKKRAWRVAKSKDGESDIKSEFLLEPITVDYDEDGLPITSCIVNTASTWRAQEPKPTDIEKDRADEQAVWDYVNTEFRAGRRPSKNSLKSNLNAIKEILPGITKVRVADAVERLIQSTRVVIEQKGKENPYLRAVDTHTGAE